MPADKIGKILVKLFGSRNERLIKSYNVIAQKSNEFEDQIRELSDEQIRARNGEFKEKLRKGADPQDILPEAFAVVREAAARHVEMRHFDVQLIGGNVLYEGNIAEMATGEGKTLVATLAVYLTHLTGRKVHLVTVNDYLARRDAEWMTPVYDALGLTVGAIHADLDTGGEERKSQYQRDVTYGTNNEFGFDYLRDNMKISLDRMVQPELQYAIIDEVDSILIDEARTPLIISGPAFDDVNRYKKADQVTRKLINLQRQYDRLKHSADSAMWNIKGAQGELSEAKKEKDDKRIKTAQNALEKAESEYARLQGELERTTQYYEVDLEKKAVHLTDEGTKAAQEIAGVGSFYTGANMDWPHLLEQSLRAHATYEREKDYVVMDNKVVIVDSFTGRLMHGRQWSDGLHQAVEAKESVEIKEETQTLATITLQNFFKLYDKIAGMTGTAATEADEFLKIYGLDVVVIPTNKPCIRDDRNDVIYKTMSEKFNAIVDQINDVSAAGRPVLVGTVSIEKSEALSKALKRKYGVDHEVLNAKQHAREAAIVEKAGQQHHDRHGKLRGNVTIATNMAGRGTDIKLAGEVLFEVVSGGDSQQTGGKVYKLRQKKTNDEIAFGNDDTMAQVFQVGSGQKWVGGLHILGSERHEARRIDNQLRGRAGRQGDPGSSQFFLSFEDDLMKIFAPEWTVKALSWIGWEQGQPIYHKRISKGIEKAQKKVEEKNFDIRKNLLEYDEVMDYQRRIFYSRRREILAGEDLKQIINVMLESVVSQNCEHMLGKQYHLNCIVEWAGKEFAAELRPSDIDDLSAEEIEELIKNRAKDDAAGKIGLSLGEYLEDYEDSRSWDISGLCKWAMRSFDVNLSPSRVKYQSPEEIEEQLIEAASAQIGKKDCSMLIEFLKEDFPLKTFADWAKAKFDIKLDISELVEKTQEQIRDILLEKIAEKYKQQEIRYPVDFAMNMVYGPDGPNVYGFQTLAEWAKRKYNTQLSVEQMQETSPRKLYKQLLDISRQYNDGQLEREIDEKVSLFDKEQLAEWASERFETSLGPEELGSESEQRERLADIAHRFLRKELSDLEKYVLLQVYDSTWKEHLYTMDHLKESIWMRSLAQKDPKIEYKREGFRTFDQMLNTVEERVTDIIFKIKLSPQTTRKSVWNVSQTAHDQMGQFSMAQRQRAAAQAPQKQDGKIATIKLDKPKVGRNDPCPCGSGKKYKKCCGKFQ